MRPLVLCRLGGRTYAVDLLSIREIIPIRGATRLPKSPPFVSGLMNVRGTIVTVLDLSRRLGGSGATADASVVLVEHRGKLVGVAVDEVTEVLRLRPDEIDPPGPEHGTPGVVTGVGHSGESIVIILDIHSIIQQVML
ncbi:MAG TPA: chemotaxis protein CheW [Gemmatimonadaceae bacterium]|nr:chemotaxis protein CheW [Gemmatimonadaceae bacterium]